MSDEKFDEKFVVRVTQGRAGLDAEEADWEVVEVRGDGTEETACDNLTKAEAQHIADMWTRKKEEAEAEARASQLQDKL